MIADLVFFGIIIIGLIIGSILGFTRGFLVALKWIVTIILLVLVVDKISVLIMNANEGGKLADAIYQNIYQKTDLDKAIYLGNGKFSYGGNNVSVDALLSQLRLPENMMTRINQKLTTLVVEGERVSVSLAKTTTLYVIKAVVSITLIILVALVFAIIKRLLTKSEKEDKRITIIDRGIGSITGAIVGCLVALVLLGLVILLQDLDGINVAYVHIMGESKVLKPIAESDFMNKILRIK